MFDVVINSQDSQESPLFRMVGDDLLELIETAMAFFEKHAGRYYQLICWVNGRLFRFATIEEFVEDVIADQEVGS